MNTKANWASKLCPTTIDSLDWQSVTESFKWVRLMMKCRDQGDHHGEGDLFRHTHLCAKTLPKLEHWDSLAIEEREILFFATLFHDVAKLKEELTNGAYPNHEDIGAKMVRAAFYRNELFPIAFEKREAIVHLVQYHHFPQLYAEQNLGLKALIKASCSTNLLLLTMLAEANVLGRIASKKSDWLDAILDFTEMAEQHQCLRESYPFKSDNAKFHYFHNENTSLNFEPHTQFKSKVIMMCGLPASGKDTLVNELYGDLPVVSFDEIRRNYGMSYGDDLDFVIETAKGEAKTFLKLNQDFVWNAPNLSAATRAKWIRLFTNHGAEVELHYVEAPYPILLERLKMHDASIPKEVIEDLIDDLEVPEVWESHQVKYHVMDAEFTKVD